MSESRHAEERDRPPVGQEPATPAPLLTAQELADAAAFEDLYKTTSWVGLEDVQSLILGNARHAWSEALRYERTRLDGPAMRRERLIARILELEAKARTWHGLHSDGAWWAEQVHRLLAESDPALDNAHLDPHSSSPGEAS